MIEREPALDLLDRALAAATDAGADAADAVLYQSDGALTRFANNTIHQNVAAEDATLCLRAVRGTRTGCVRTGVLSTDGVAAAARKAADIAAVAAEDPEFPGILHSPPAEPRAAFDPDTARTTPEQRAAAVREIIGRIDEGGAAASGSLATRAASRAVANTAGTRQFERRTRVSLNVVAMAGTAAGCATFSGPRLAELDPAERAGRALETCLRSRDPADLEPGEYPVVLEPAAVAVLLQFLARLGFGAQAMQQGQSCFQGKVGEAVCDERIWITDDPHDPAASPVAFDGEGVPTRRVELIDAGVLRGVVHDTRTAAKDGVESTGNGGVPPNPYGPFPHTLLMAPGEEDLGAMIATTGRGLLVSRFHYTNVAERATATLTGMTRYGLFEIRDGAAGRPVKNLRFTQSVLGALNAVEGVGRERERFGSTLVPALRLARFRFTSKSDH
jgi:predicted Zn-dependent protease